MTSTAIQRSHGCRNCGRATFDRYCGFDDCTQDLAQSVVRRRGWAGRWMFLAVLLAGASAALITFFQRQDWQDAVVRWAFQHEQYDLVVAVATGSWGGRTWHQWAAAGLGGSAVFFALSMLLSFSAARTVRSVPGLKLAVKAEQQQSWGVMKTLGALAVIPLVIGFFVIVIAAAAGAGGNGAHHHDD